ncbi:MAG: hypothetical protein MJ144_01685 [Clostridia bacterium]|nr:hypothetical protein [Clostridia bacterium]
MQALQWMSVDQMVIILPSALIAMYLIISFQKRLCQSNNKYLGLIVPVVCFIASTVLAIRPLIVGDPSQQAGLLGFCIRMWLTFNISTIVFGFQYLRERKMKKALEEQMAAMEAEAQALSQMSSSPEGASEEVSD